MSNTDQNYSPFIIVIGLIISIGRVILGNMNIGDAKDSVILIVMAIVNYVALGFVLLFLYNGFYNCFNFYLNKSGLTTKQKKNSCSISHIISFVLLIVYCFLGYIYITEYYNSNMNDAISIFALSISIANDGLIDKYGILFYKAIIKTAKLIK